MDIDTRLKKLEAIMERYQGVQNFTVFILEDGSSFTTKQDPLAYLLEHGTETPKGRIVIYPHPVDGVDGLSLSMFALINEEIASGTMRQTIGGLESEN